MKGANELLHIKKMASAQQLDFKETLCPWQDNYLRQFHSHSHSSKIDKDDLDESDDGDEQDTNMKVVYNTLELQDDIYCATYLAFLRESKPCLHQNMMIKVSLVFVLQVCIIVLLFQYYQKKEGIFNHIDIGEPSINSARLICCFLLHIQLIPEVRCALDMFLYAKIQPQKFKGDFVIYPFAIALAKGLTGIAAEILCIFTIV